MLATNARSKILLCLCVAGLASAWLGLEVLRLVPADSSERLIDLVALSAGGAAFLLGVVILARHFRDPAEAEEGKPAPAAERLGVAAAGALPAALRCLDQPAVVISENGRIVQTNPVAAVWLDGLARPGAHIGDVVEMTDLRQALIKARGERVPAPTLLRRRDGGGEVTARVADIGLQAGAVLLFDAAAPPPAAPVRPGGRWGVAFDPAQPLTALPVTALLVETTDGQVTEIATVKLAGGRVYPALSLDFIVARPEQGRAGRRFAEIWPELAQALTGTVVVAENAAAAWAALQGELTACGFAVVEPPPLLDLVRLAARFDPPPVGADAAALAQALSVSETVPVRRLARVAAALIVGPNGQGAGSFGECVATTGESDGDALKPASITSCADEGI